MRVVCEVKIKRVATLSIKKKKRENLRLFDKVRIAAPTIKIKTF